MDCAAGVVAVVSSPDVVVEAGVVSVSEDGAVGVVSVSEDGAVEVGVVVVLLGVVDAVVVV